MPDESESSTREVGELHQAESTSRTDALQQALTVIAAWAELLDGDPELPEHARRAVAVIHARATEAVRLLHAGVLAMGLVGLLHLQVFTRSLLK
jgi:hypothetical protein